MSLQVLTSTTKLLEMNLFKVVNVIVLTFTKKLHGMIILFWMSFFL